MKVLKTTLVIIGSVIGAGFASGKEIFTYFGKYGIFSLLFTVPLFFFLKFLLNTYLKFGHYNEFLSLKASNNVLCKTIKIAKMKVNYLDIGLFFTFLIQTSAMFSGLIALFSSYIPNGNHFIYFSLALIITLILIKTNFNSFKTLTNIVVPIIIICLVINVLCSFASHTFSTDFGVTNVLPLPFMTVAYASQNTFFISFIVIKLGKELDLKQCKKVSFLSSLILSILVCLGIVCFLFNPKIIFSQMPFVEIAMSINPIFSFMFSIVMLFSILTTHATCITSLKEFFNNDKKYNNIFLMLILIVLVSMLNFGKIVEYLYPLIGAFGIIYFYKIYTYDKHKRYIPKKLQST